MELIPQFDLLFSFLLVITAFIICGLGALRIVNHSLPVVYPTPRPLRIGGWLIVIAILEIFAVLAYLFELFALQIWKNDFWLFVPISFAPKGYYLSLSLEISYALLVVFTFCGALLSLYLLFKRRDIFPRVLTYYSIISCIAYTVIMVFRSWNAPEKLAVLVSVEYSSLFINLLITGLIIRYVNRSVRAKETFVLPHPSLVDYDEPDFQMLKTE